MITPFYSGDVMDNTKPAIKFLVDDTEAAEALGISRAHFLALEKQGAIGPKPVEGLGRRRLYRVSELEKWVDCGLPRRIDWSNNANHSN